MSDIIQLLPDNIANQIAAGEVIQRPANALKELVENAIDANATKISIIVENGGIQSLQIIDDGKGMSSTDARMCFERHATSKIKTIEDIYQIKTMGFRGEALASIAAIATVILKTKQASDKVGTMIEIENAKILQQNPIMIADGTNILVKNLFFNVPARKHFLKSEKKELEGIVEEFLRIAIPFHPISFELISNEKIIYNLQKSNLKSRILQIYKTYYNEADFISIQQEYNGMRFHGLLGKPNVSRTTRGHQYFFVNQRFVKNNYLGHAVNSAFSTLIDKEHFPTYFIFIEIDTTTIDVNVHPTKQEIKFQDEKTVYAFLQATIRKTLTQYAVTPSINFDAAKTERLYEALNVPTNTASKNRALDSDLHQQFSQKHQAHFIASGNSDWKEFYQSVPQAQRQEETVQAAQHLFEIHDLKKENWLQKKYLQFQQEYIITTYQKLLLIVHQQLAHQIILYEQYAKSKEHFTIISEPLLFPITFALSTEDQLVFEEMQQDLNAMGYEITNKNATEFEILAAPNNIAIQDLHTDIEKIIEAYKHLTPQVEIHKKEKLIRCLSLKNSLKVGKSLQQEEMQNLVHQLFQTNNPLYTYGNMKSFVLINQNTIDALF